MQAKTQKCLSSVYNISKTDLFTKMKWSNKSQNLNVISRQAAKINGLHTFSLSDLTF